MALTSVLCLAAILMLRSGWALAAREHGFDPNGVLTFSVVIPRNAYTGSGKEIFYRDARAKLAAIAGVEAVGFATSVPWTGHNDNTSFAAEGYTPTPSENPGGRYQAATPGFFRAAGMRLTVGREIAESEDSKAPPVVGVNEMLAQRYFAGRGALGRKIEVFGQWRTIVGVGSDVPDSQSEAAAKPAFWMALTQNRFERLRAALRTRGEPLALTAPVRAAMASVDPEMALAEMRTMASIARAALAERTFALWWCELFARSRWRWRRSAPTRCSPATSNSGTAKSESAWG
jgi:hypothetical protein